MHRQSAAELIPSTAVIALVMVILLTIGGGDGTLFAGKYRDTLIEQSGSGYSNRAVTVFREAV